MTLQPMSAKNSTFNISPVLTHPGRLLDDTTPEEVMDFVQAYFDSLSMKELLQTITSHAKLDLVLDEASQLLYTSPTNHQQALHVPTPQIPKLQTPQTYN